MIGALDGLAEPAGVLLTEPGSAVSTHVVVGAYGSTPIPEQDDAFSPHLLQDVVAGFPDLIFPTDAEPAPRKDALELRRKHLRSNVVSPGQSSGSAYGDLGRLEKLGHRALVVRISKYGRGQIGAEGRHLTRITRRR
jgi:hypothetical protein